MLLKIIIDSFSVITWLTTELPLGEPTYLTWLTAELLRPFRWLLSYEHRFSP